MKNKNKIKKSQTLKKGFSLIEALVAIFIFSLAMTMVVGSFSSFFKNYVNSKKIQRDIENAQYAMNLMAKTLRTSSVVTTETFPLDAYDYSQDRCIEYIFNNVSKILQYHSTVPATVGDPATCSYGSGTLYDLTSNNIESAVISASATDDIASPVVFGKVTLALSVRDQSNTTAATPIQMTVSLRQ